MNDKRRENSDVRSYYLKELLVWRLAQIRSTPLQVAQKSGVSHPKVADALSGQCKKFETLWKITTALDLKWEYLFKLDLPESQFRRAVLTWGSESVR